MIRQRTPAEPGDAQHPQVDLFAGQVAIVPAPVISPLTLLAFPVVLLVANLIAAIPARTAARTQPAIVLRAE